VRVPLRDLCATRAGDKGDISNIAVFAYDEAVYAVLREQVTAERVRAHFGDLVQGEVRRYEAANVLGLNFVLERALGGGGPRSLRSDNLGKTLGGALLRLEVEVPDGTPLRPRPPVPAPPTGPGAP
jgi:hypothetical protein